MSRYEILAKRNRDESYSASIPVGMLVSNAFVDYWAQATSETRRSVQNGLGRSRTTSGGALTPVSPRSSSS